MLVQANSGSITYDSATSLYWWIGSNWNTPFDSTNTQCHPRGVWAFTSSNLFNWTQVGQILPPCPINLCITAGSYLLAQTRRTSSSTLAH